MIDILDHIDLLVAACRLHKKWGIYVSFSSLPQLGAYRELAENQQAAPWFFGDLVDSGQAWIDGSGVALFDSEAEMQAAFDATVGDEGPTETNPYNGPAKVYAITCDPNGTTRDENT